MPVASSPTILLSYRRADAVHYTRLLQYQLRELVLRLKSEVLMSTNSQSESKSTHSEARAAIYGLLGAIIGGLATFGGAYWTGHQAQSETQSTSQRSAYVIFGGAAQQYILNLVQLGDAIDHHNGESYKQIRTQLLAEWSPLYSDFITIRLISPTYIGDDALKLLQAITFYVPISPSSIDRHHLNSVITAGNDRTDRFESAAQAQLNS